MDYIFFSRIEFWVLFSYPEKKTKLHTRKYTIYQFFGTTLKIISQKGFEENSSSLNSVLKRGKSKLSLSWYHSKMLKTQMCKSERPDPCES